MNGTLTAGIERRIKTTFIGSVCSHEKHFGFLWGQEGYPSLFTPEQIEILTDLQPYFKTLRETHRNQVLNQGNNQLRAARSEINNFLSKD